jgi:hypothetical protein
VIAAGISGTYPSVVFRFKPNAPIPGGIGFMPALDPSGFGAGFFCL